MRLQISLEYLIIIGIVLGLLVPFVYTSVQRTNEFSYEVLRVQLDDVKSAIEAVAIQGFPASRTSILCIPYEVLPGRTYLANRTIQVSVGTISGPTDFYRTLDARCVEGTIPAEGGCYTIYVNSTRDCVSVSYG